MPKAANQIEMVVVEIPKLSSNKYEYNRQTGQMELDRVLMGSMS